MENLTAYIQNSETIVGLCILIGVFALTPLLKARIRRLKALARFPLLLETLPSLVNLVYLVGLRGAADLLLPATRADRWIDGFIYIVSTLIVVAFARRILLSGIRFFAERHAKRNDFETLEQGFLPLMRNLVTLFVFLTGAIMVLQHFGYDVMSLIAALGVGSLAVGLAAQDTLKHMISGFTLIIDRNLHPGDRINLGGTLADVEEIGLRSTLLRVPDGNTLIVPNSDLVNNKILNLSLPSRDVACSSVLRVPYAEEFETVRALCLKVVTELRKQESGFSKTGSEPAVVLSSLAEGYQTITVAYWALDFATSATLMSKVNEGLLSAFKREKISLQGPDPLRLPS